MNEINGLSVSVVVEGQRMWANPKTFKSGKVGYHVSQKLEIDGRRYQANVCLVEISKQTHQHNGVQITAADEALLAEIEQNTSKKASKKKEG